MKPIFAVNPTRKPSPKRASVTYPERTEAELIGLSYDERLSLVQSDMASFFKRLATAQ